MIVVGGSQSGGNAPVIVGTTAPQGESLTETCLYTLEPLNTPEPLAEEPPAGA
jgi:hypothetical protein